MREPWASPTYDHPHDGGDDCTAVFLDEELCASLCGGEPALPLSPLRVSPGTDLEHRLLLGKAKRGADAETLGEGALAIVAEVLSSAEPARTDSGRPSTARTRRELVRGAREALAADPNRSLVALARELAVAPHHLSRVFRAETGQTISRHRMRMRTRSSLERLAAGERDLARLAADLGFADQSHLTRVLRSETGETPASLRAALAP